MSMKVKRGLGLLVVALIGFLAIYPMQSMSPDGFLNQALLLVALAVAGVAFFVGLVGGLGLLAWGLLRD